MNRFLKRAAAGAALLMILGCGQASASEDIVVKYHATLCGTFKGSWDATNRQDTFREPTDIVCVLRDKVGAACVLRAGDQKYQFTGRFGRTEDVRLVIEVDDEKGRTLQLFCHGPDNCFGYRIFNEQKQSGMACTSDQL